MRMPRPTIRANESDAVPASVERNRSTVPRRSFAASGVRARPTRKRGRLSRAPDRTGAVVSRPSGRPDPQSARRTRR